MANELTLYASLQYADSELSAFALATLPAVVSNVTMKLVEWVKMSVGLSEVALKLGTITSLGWFMGINRDPTNFIELRVSTGSTKFCKMMKGEPAFFRFGSGISAPYAIADTAACQIEYLLISV